MEIKLLLYILAGIIWFFYKSVGEKKQKSAGKIPSDAQPEIVRKAPVKPVIQVLPQERKKEIPSSLFQNKPKTSDQRVANYVNPEMRTYNKSFEADQYNYDTHPYNNLTNRGESEEYSDMEITSAGSLIGDSIRNGSMNWKQAVVINELLRPAYL